MKNRTCVIWLTVEDATKQYTACPLEGADLPSPFVSGFRLVGLSDSPSPKYLVRLAADGAVNCSCPRWQKTEKCKHADALVAAEMLPVRFVQLLAERSRELDRAEAELKSLTEKAIEEQMVYQHDSREMRDRIAELEWSLRSVEERAAQLQVGLAAAQAAKPRRRTRRDKAA